MIRAFFLACGTFLSLCGGLLLLVDRVVLTDAAARQFQATGGPSISSSNDRVSGKGAPAWPFVTRNAVDPPDWGAFGLLSLGGVTLLYTFALPGRREDDEDWEDFDEEDDWDRGVRLRRRRRSMIFRSRFRTR